MPRPSNVNIFLRKLKELGGSTTNAALRSQLDWDENKYWKVHEELCDLGAVARGRGRGGTVILRAPESAESVPEIVQSLPPREGPLVAEFLAEVLAEEVAKPSIKEAELYKPLERELKKFLKTRKGLQECDCQTTASQGSRNTGGSWSRPDLIAVGVRVYEYLPSKSVEFHSFEVKASYDISVKGVLEALSHREGATHSHVVYHTDGQDWDALPEARRIEQLAARHGIGVIVATNIDDWNDWDELVVASRSNADPEIIDRGIGGLSDDLKSKVRRWTR